MDLKGRVLKLEEFAQRVSPPVDDGALETWRLKTLETINKALAREWDRQGLSDVEVLKKQNTLGEELGVEPWPLKKIKEIRRMAREETIQANQSKKED